jgi:hypothetical protein
VAYPTDLDTFSEPPSPSTTPLGDATYPHAAHHTNVGNAVEALEAKLGIGASAASAASFGQWMQRLADGTTAWGSGVFTPADLNVTPTDYPVGVSFQSTAAATAGTPTTTGGFFVVTLKYTGINVIQFAHQRDATPTGTDTRLWWRFGYGGGTPEWAPWTRVMGHTEPLETSSGSGTVNLDLLLSSVFKHTLTGATTFAFTNPPAAAQGAASFTLYTVQNATGGYAITWPASVDWASGAAPAPVTTANAVNVWTFQSIDGGTTWYGFLSGKDMK